MGTAGSMGDRMTRSSEATMAREEEEGSNSPVIGQILHHSLGLSESVNQQMNIWLTVHCDASSIRFHT